MREKIREWSTIKRMNILKHTHNKRLWQILFLVFSMKFAAPVFVIFFSLFVILKFTIDGFESRPGIVDWPFNLALIYSGIGFGIFLIKILIFMVKKIHTRLSYTGIIIFSVVIITFLFAGYMHKYQQVVNIIGALLDERCLKIEPILAKKQDSAFKYFNASYSNTSKEVSDTYLGDTIRYTKELVDISEPWLNKYAAFLDSFDFQFFTDPVRKEVHYAFVNKLYADYLSNEAALVYFLDPGNEARKQQVIDSIKKQDDKGGTLKKKVEAALNHSDIRDHFVKAPHQKCIPKIEETPSILVDPKGPTG